MSSELKRCDCGGRMVVTDARCSSGSIRRRRTCVVCGSIVRTVEVAIDKEEHVLISRNSRGGVDVAKIEKIEVMREVRR